ncbi:MAG TPA: glutaredoxin family protein [candidate division WOR-3 bacterium]|uniref:Glutaredoxin family protein n=1 Tax=candidate division WOR-3 bacterium TaxID=2052148 RepID=A0A7V0T671_UNCW3|nr:glutaredoxin family protein [candidate division WOR-3 bacterium]
MPTAKEPGANKKHKVRLYGLSTCGWCRKTKELLDSQQVEYEYVYVDQCEGDERAELTAAVRALNPRGSFPTVEIDGEVVVGYDDDRILELLG